MLKLIKPNAVPSGGGYAYWQEETKTKFIIPTMRNLIRTVQDHCKNNGLEIPTEQKIIENCCEQRPNLCFDDQSPNAARRIQTFMGSMAQWAASGFSLATEEELNRRVSICEECVHWGGVAGGTLIKGKCGKCGCNGIKLALDTSVCPISKW